MTAKLRSLSHLWLSLVFYTKFVELITSIRILIFATLNDPLIIDFEPEEKYLFFVSKFFLMFSNRNSILQKFSYLFITNSLPHKFYDPTPSSMIIVCTIAVLIMGDCILYVGESDLLWHSVNTSTVSWQPVS